MGAKELQSPTLRAFWRFPKWRRIAAPQRNLVTESPIIVTSLIFQENPGPPFLCGLRLARTKEPTKEPSLLTTGTGLFAAKQGAVRKCKFDGC